MELKFKTVKHVTLPLMKVELDTAYYIKFESKIFKSDPITDRSGTPVANTTGKEPPELARVVNLETGDMSQIIISAVLGSELRKAYKEDSYVGKSFEVIKHKIESKKYATFEITEIQLEADKPAETQKPAEKPTAPAQKPLTGAAGRR